MVYSYHRVKYEFHKTLCGSKGKGAINGQAFERGEKNTMVLIAKVDKAGILKDLDEIMSMTRKLEEKATRLRERISIEESDTDSSIDSE